MQFNITKRFIRRKYLLGAVGQLQFEVFEHRMKNEYNVDVLMEYEVQKLLVGLKMKKSMKNYQAQKSAR